VTVVAASDWTSRPWVVATRSAGKIAELLPLLAHYGRRAVTLAEAGVVETGAEDELEAYDTFAANALAKARFFAAQTGGVVLADDSGLTVDALDGRPGVRSKRWSGRADLDGRALDVANNAFLQQALREVRRFGREERTAQYVCAAACVWPAGELVVVGETTGMLLDEPVGTGGFGYDPYFQSDDLGCSFGEATGAQKSLVSHRGRAFRRLLEELSSELSIGS
jgi:XTP/dITP diphosphohydrolase